VRTVECTGCMTCVESCPVASTLSFHCRLRLEHKATVVNRYGVRGRCQVLP
jgi:ferredoxin